MVVEAPFVGAASACWAAGCWAAVAGQPPAGAGMMSRPSWWRRCAGMALLEIVIVTYGFFVEPVAWQIVVLPALAWVLVTAGACVFAWPLASALPCTCA